MNKISNNKLDIGHWMACFEQVRSREVEIGNSRLGRKNV